MRDSVSGRRCTSIFSSLERPQDRVKVDLPSKNQYFEPRDELFRQAGPPFKSD
jgi:hypothetical protein